MALNLKVRARTLGRKRALVPDFSVPIPGDLPTGGGRLTLRDLITRVVLEGVEAFKERQEENRFVRLLTERQIEQGQEAGKITSGGQDLDQGVSPEGAVAVALQAFEDGLYYVFIDEVQHTDLEQAVYLQDESTLTFVRLVALTGG